jgi:hypothetical protein
LSRWKESKPDGSGSWSELWDKNTNLRRALYGEIISLASNIGPHIHYHKDKCTAGETEYLKYPDRDKIRVDLSFRVYESLKKDPLAFYQLEEAPSIDFAYDRLNMAYTLLQYFGSSSFDANEARVKCASLVGVYKTSLFAIDTLYDSYKHILLSFDEGRFVVMWDALKKVEEDNFGPIK